MKRQLAALAMLVTLSASPAITSTADALEFKPGTRDAKVAQITVVGVMARFACPNIEPDSGGIEAAMREFGITDDDLVDKRYGPDINELTASYGKDMAAACREIETGFGPNGDQIRGLVRPRAVPKKPVEGSFPAGSAESKAALLVATSTFVNNHCSTLAVDDETSAAALNGLYVSRDALYSPAFALDAFQKVQAYESDPHGCDLAWKRYGMDGEVTPRVLIKKR